MRLTGRALAGILLLCVCGFAETVKTPVWTEGEASDLRFAWTVSQSMFRLFNRLEDDLILLVVLDTVNLPDRTDAAREAFLSRMAELGPKAFAGVLSAQDGLQVQQDPTRNRNLLREKLEAIDVRGLPGLLDAVEQASQIADSTLEAADVRVAVLFITDGAIEDYRGDYTSPVVNPSDTRDLSRRFRNQLILERIRAIVDSLESSQAPLFFLHLARQFDDLNEVYQNGINEFAAVTAGEAMFAQSLQEVPAMIETLMDRIAAHSVLTIEADPEQPQSLEVTSPSGTVEHREKIRCPPPSS